MHDLKDTLSQKFIILSLFVAVLSCTPGRDNPEISSDFPGGNIEVISFSADTFRLRPDTSNTQWHWFYWYFRVSGVEGRNIRFVIDQDNALLAASGPAYSINGRDNWKWLGKNAVNDRSFSFQFSENDTVAYFALAPPYVEENLKEFLSSVQNREKIKESVLCISPEGRKVEKLIINPIGEPRYRMLITARHHACEMMANYEIEGLVDAVLNDENLEYLRENVEFMIIPFMDKDGVENGEQGKLSIPKDHNRDYTEKPIYRSTASLMEIIPGWSGDKLKFALDLHCPYISDTVIFMVGNIDPEIESQQLVFSGLLEKNSFGEMKSFHRDFLEAGASWNSGSNSTFSNWAAKLSNIKLASTLEYPYSEVSGIPVSIQGTRDFGKTIALSIQEYFMYLDAEQ